MSIFDIFKKSVPPDAVSADRRNTPLSSANQARERLLIVVTEDRNRRRQDAQKSLITVMENEVYLLVQKYFKISKEDMQIKLSQQDDKDILELNIDIHGKEMLDANTVNASKESDSDLPKPPTKHE